MHPIKNHRIVRHRNATEGSVRREAAIESAENEGWPLQNTHAVRMEWNLRINGDATAPVLAMQPALTRAGE